MCGYGESSVNDSLGGETMRQLLQERESSMCAASKKIISHGIFQQGAFSLSPLSVLIAVRE
jgi:hypothetical protein